MLTWAKLQQNRLRKSNQRIISTASMPALIGEMNAQALDPRFRYRKYSPAADASRQRAYNRRQKHRLLSFIVYIPEEFAEVLNSILRDLGCEMRRCGKRMPAKPYSVRQVRQTNKKTKAQERYYAMRAAYLALKDLGIEARESINPSMPSET
jgi:hypothetical protein